jgi:hypothetical protein
VRYDLIAEGCLNTIGMGRDGPGLLGVGGEVEWCGQGWATAPELRTLPGTVRLSEPVVCKCILSI